MEENIALTPAVAVSEDPLVLKEAVLRALDAEKIDDVTVIPLGGRSSLADFMIIGTGTSSRRVAAAAQKLIHVLKPLCRRTPSCEGLNVGDWVLIDAGDVLVHLFRPEVRAHYALEKIWTEASPRPDAGVASAVTTHC